MKTGKAPAITNSPNEKLSQSGGMIEKFPRHLEFLRQLCGERFHAEGLGRIVTAEEKVDSELSGCDCRPVRRFACDVGVDSFPRRGVDFSTGTAGHDADPFGFHWARAHAADWPA